MARKHGGNAGSENGQREVDETDGQSEASERRQPLLDRRSYIKMGAAAVASVSAGAGFAGAAAGSTTFRGFEFSNVIDAVADWDVDNTGQNDAAETLSNNVSPGDLVVFPDGEYRFEQQLAVNEDSADPIGFVAASAYNGGDWSPVDKDDGSDTYDYSHNVTILGTANNYTFNLGGNISYLVEGFYFDEGEASVKWGCGVRMFSAKDSEVRNIEQVGVGNRDGPTAFTTGGGVGDDATIWAHQFTYRRGTNDPSQYSGSSRHGMQFGGSASTTIRLVGVDVREFSDNGCYAINTNHTIQVEDSYFENNNVSHVRIAGDSHCKNTEMVYDQSRLQADNLDQTDESWAGRCHWMNPADTSYTSGGPTVLENNTYTIRDWAHTGSGAGSLVMFSDDDANGWVMRGCDIDVQLSDPDNAFGSSTAMLYNNDGGTSPSGVHLDNVTMKADNLDTNHPPVEFTDTRDSYNWSPDTLIENCCIETTNSPDVAGIRLQSENYSYAVDVSDSRVNVDGSVYSAQSGVSVSTSNIEETGSCTLGDGDDGGSGDTEPAETFETGFSETAVGDTPNNWTPRWNASSDQWQASEDDSSHFLGFDATDSNRYALSWDAVPSDSSDVEVLGKVRVPTVASSGNHARLHLRSSGSSGNENGYYFDFQEEGFALYKYTNAELTRLARTGTTAADTWYWVRARANGTDLKLKYWEATNDEPSAWDLETTDTDHDNGWVGVGAWDSDPSHWDAVSVGTGGETAPLVEETTTEPVTVGTDFGDETAGDTPQNWTPQWASSGSDWNVQKDTAALGDRRLALESSTDARHALAWDAVPSDSSDVEVLGKVRVPTVASSGNHARLHLRSSGSSGNENGYYFDFQEEGFALYKYTNAELTRLARTGTTAADTWYWVRVRANGTDLKLKYWEATNDEPSAWDLETTDTDHDSGWVGVGAWDSDPSHWGAVSAATGGDSAPLLGPDSVVVDTLNATTIDTESATLNGELVDLNGTESVDVYFEWRAVGADTWNTTEIQALDSSAPFEAQLTGLESGSEYEYRSVAESTTTTTRGDTVSFGTIKSGPSIDRLDLEDRSNKEWARVRIDWEVTSTGSELDTVLSELIRSGVVDSELESVSGSSAAGTHDLKERTKERARYDVRLTAVDVDGVSSSKTVEITL